MTAPKSAILAGRRLDACICVLLALATAAVYGQTAWHAFVGYDDPVYLTRNITVLGGVTADGFRWAFSTWHAANWHPLTWLSHMLDVEMWGLWPGGHHLTSSALHVVNTLLLFGLLRALTKERWRSTLVAALFALHPLHVESVAWVSERKDVLSTLFGLGSLWLYATWTRKRGTRLYLSALVSFALSLLAKPVWLTLPALLLLLDFWPLRRVGRSERGERAVGSETVPDESSRARLALEKIPFAILSLASALVTLVAQRQGGALWSSAEVPLLQRFANAAVSTWRYLGKALWPTDLSVLYPHPYIAETGGSAWSPWQVAASLTLLLVLSAAIWRLRSRRYLLFGWLWYLVALVPVIGIVQVGAQGMADRYSYVSLIGVFIGIVWTAGDELRKRSMTRTAAALSILALLCFSLLSFRQVQVWRDSVTLFEHALARAPGNWILHAHLGDALLEDGKPSRSDAESAAQHYRAVVAIRPDHLGARASLASLLSQLGRSNEAAEQLREIERRRRSTSSGG